MADALNQVDLAFVVDTTGSMGAFIDAAKRHMVALLRALNVRPAVTIVKVGQAGSLLETSCRELGVPLNVFEFRGDYYALPNVIPLLTHPSQTELLMEILNYPLPRRRVS